VDRQTRVLTIIAIALAIGAALALYQPILRIGLLSDDYALLMWARRLELLPRDWGQIRPLPIVAWWLLAEVTSPVRTPAAIHALNVALHGLNAVFVGVLAAQLLGSARLKAGPTTAVRLKPDTTTEVGHPLVAPGFSRAGTAAALFLTMPIAVEAVAWGSGVFDVMLATFALTLAVVAARRPQLTAADQALCLLLGIAMLTSKETGVIAALLLLLVHWARWGRIDRSAVAVAATLLVVVASYALIRELTGRLDHRLTPRFDIDALGRLLAGIGRAFIMPLHRDVVMEHPALAAIYATLVMLALAALIVRTRRSPEMMRVGVLALAGTLLCVAPTIRIFGITPDLQGTRYVYLAGAWWSIALAAALKEGWRTPRMRALAWTVAALLIVGGTAATRAHLRPWLAARVERDRVLRQLISVPASCRRIGAPAATDNVAGAYVFRNGLNEALATLGRSYEWVSPDQAAPECRAR
jgi:hypothetical protein